MLYGVEAEFVVARARVMVVGRVKDVVGARTARETVEGAGERSHVILEEADVVTRRGGRPGQRGRDRGAVDEEKEGQKKMMQSAHLVVRGGRTAQKRSMGLHNLRKNRVAHCHHLECPEKSVALLCLGHSVLDKY